MTTEAWDAIRDIAKATWSPRKGIRVNITRGKHKGKSGVVFWHGVDKYTRINYESAVEGAMSQIIGRNGYRIGVQTDDGEKFFTAAVYAANPDCKECGGAGEIDGRLCCCLR